MIQFGYSLVSSLEVVVFRPSLVDFRQSTDLFREDFSE
jgi:hypothetical protein